MRNPMAMALLGYQHENGLGTTKDLYTANKYYEKAVSLEQEPGQYKMGRLYEMLPDIQDLQKSVNWYQNAVDHDVEYANDDVKRLNMSGYYAMKRGSYC
jgi:TPR repeat protein